MRVQGRCRRWLWMARSDSNPGEQSRLKLGSRRPAAVDLERGVSLECTSWHISGVPACHDQSRFQPASHARFNDNVAYYCVIKINPPKKTTGELPEQNPCDRLSKGGNRAGVMPLHAYRANPEGGIGAAFRGRVIPLDRRERRRKNGSVRPLGTHRLKYKE